MRRISPLQLSALVFVGGGLAFQWPYGPFFEYSRPESSAGAGLFLDRLRLVEPAFCEIGGGSVGRFLDNLFLYNLPALCYFLKGTSGDSRFGLIWVGEGNRGAWLCFEVVLHHLSLLVGEKEGKKLGQEELVA